MILSPLIVQRVTRFSQCKSLFGCLLQPTLSKDVHCSHYEKSSKYTCVFYSLFSKCNTSSLVSGIYNYYFVVCLRIFLDIASFRSLIKVSARVQQSHYEPMIYKCVLYLLYDISYQSLILIPLNLLLAINIYTHHCARYIRQYNDPREMFCKQLTYSYDRV